MKILSILFAVLFIISFTICILFLFHIGGTNLTTQLEYDQFAAISYLESIVFFILYLKANNKISIK